MRFIAGSDACDCHLSHANFSLKSRQRDSVSPQILANKTRGDVLEKPTFLPVTSSTRRIIYQTGAAQLPLARLGKVTSEDTGTGFRIFLFQVSHSSYEVVA